MPPLSNSASFKLENFSKQSLEEEVRGTDPRVLFLQSAPPQLFLSLVHTGGGDTGKTGEGSCHRRLEATAEGVAGTESVCEWQESEKGEGLIGQW